MLFVALEHPRFRQIYDSLRAALRTNGLAIRPAKVDHELAAPLVIGKVADGLMQSPQRESRVAPSALSRAADTRGRRRPRAGRTVLRLEAPSPFRRRDQGRRQLADSPQECTVAQAPLEMSRSAHRSEERRVGKECRSRRSREERKKKMSCM